jgi:acyl-CoA synthetase (AMP-forming)/AMP-acid ligase II
MLEGGSITQFSYGDALYETRRWAEILSRNGVQQGDRVVIALKHRHELYFAFLGALWLGASPAIIPFPTPKQDPAIYWAEYETLLAHVIPRIVVTYAENATPLRAVLANQSCIVLDADAAGIAGIRPMIASAPAASSLDDTALLQFSSGTTGLRKGVMLSHRQIAQHMDAYAEVIGFGPEDTVASWLPLYHDMGLIACFLMPLHAGATIVSLDAFDWVARPWSLLEAIETYGATFTWLPNFAFQHMLRTLPGDRLFKLGGMRAFVNCSEPCRPETFDRFAEALRRHGVRREQLQVCYGMAETVFAASHTELGRPPRTLTVDRHLMETTRQVQVVDASHPDGQRFLSCGRVVGDLAVRIASVHPHRERGETGQGVVGEIEIRGGHLFSGYFRNSAANAAAIADGWYRTGDLGFMHGGELFVCGRQKELLIVHGRNFYAHDIEAIVSGVEHVKPGRTIALGLDDAQSGSEEAVVLIETDLSGADERKALQRAVKKAVFDRMDLTLKSVMIVPAGSLIKTTSGKISRAANKARHLTVDRPAA